MKAHPITALAFIVADTYVRQDEQGRYSLNDLHRAAGGEDRHTPNRWTRTDTYQALLAELTAESSALQPVGQTPEMAPETPDQPSSAEAINRGGQRGTWVCIELVYAYAMWISPAFHLRVIRTYHSLLGSKQPARQDLVQARHDRLDKFSFQLVTAIDRAKTTFAREALLQQLRQVNQSLGMPVPEPTLLPAIADPIAKDKATLSAFWDAFRLMTAQGAQLNHAKDSTFIAINLPQFLTEAASRKVTVPTRAALQKTLPHSTSPAFDSSKAVKSALQEGSVHCWVFQAPPAAPKGAQAGLFMEST